MKAPPARTPSSRSPWSLSFQGPWLLFRYRPTALWSLKLSQATSSGGKTLLVPTPYSIKMGLIDAAIQTGRVPDGMNLFEKLKGRPLRICPPASAVVTATLVKIQKLGRPPLTGTLFSPTIGFREYVQFGGNGPDGDFQIVIASEGIDSSSRQLLANAARGCTYFGKRGCFFSFVPSGTQDGLEELSAIDEEAPFTLPTSIWQSGSSKVRLGTIQPLDELSAEADWDNVNTFADGSISATLDTKMGEKEGGRADRVFVHSLIPYRMVSSSSGHVYYRRVSPPD